MTYHKHILHGLVGGLVAGQLFVGSTSAESLCARVRLEIPQRLTFERQAFEARLQLNNGSAATLRDLSVDLSFADSAGNPVPATSDANATSSQFDFFFAPSGVTHPTVVEAGQSARLTWLILPTPRVPAAEEGTRYQVKAKIMYRTAPESPFEIVNLEPETIFVRPMPRLQMDYFLSALVQGDEPQTPDFIEPPIPYTLGVRVYNRGGGPASSLRLLTAQPRVMPNQGGLPQSFEFVSCEINGQAAPVTLLADIGNLASGAIKSVRWQMISPISGRFVSFEASLRHAAEYGGTTTSLIEEPTTRYLVRDVLVDLPGRDQVRDFLAQPEPFAGVMRVFESEPVGTSQEIEAGVPVLEASANLELPGTLAVTGGALSTARFVYAAVPDPFQGQKRVVAIRSDGKRILDANLWQTRRWDPNGNALLYQLHLFDSGWNPAAGSLTYSLTFLDPNEFLPPILSATPAEFVYSAGAQLFVTAVNPNGSTPPALAASPLPEGATFVDDPTQPAQNGSVRKVLQWANPVAGSVVNTRFVATVERTSPAASLSTSRVVRFNGPPPGDRYARWRSFYFPGAGEAIAGEAANPSRDGHSNLVKYALGLDPRSPSADLGLTLGVEEVGGRREMTLTYSARTDDPTLRYNVLSSNSPSGPWGVAGFVVERTAELRTLPEDGQTPVPFERVRFRDQVDLNVGLQRYMKLQVTRSNEQP